MDDCVEEVPAVGPRARDRGDDDAQGQRRTRSVQRERGEGCRGRRPVDLADRGRLLGGIHAEMRQIKRLGLGLTFVLSLWAVRRLPGGLPRMARRAKCSATSLLSNLGTVLADVPLPRQGGRIVLGGAVLEALDAVGPLRPGTYAAFSVFTYAGRFCITLHYDPRAMSPAGAGDLLEAYARRVRQSSGADIPVCQTGEISPGRQECLPHCDCLTGTAARTRQGGGVCVGRRFRDIRWKVIRIVDGPIRSIEEVEELSAGGGPAISCGAGVSPALAAGTAAPQIGELIVTGPQVTRAYVTRTQWNALSKIADGPAVWHRIGDSGYLDDRDRFWFCGRVAHRVLTADGPMYPICCEAIFNQHPAIRRSALVGVGPAGRQRPVIILEPHQGQMPKGPKQREALLAEIRQLAAANPLTARITDFLLHPHFPVDIRHNAKIFREKLAQWAERRGADRS